MKRPRNIIAHLLGTIGAAIILTELLRHWLQGHEMEGGVIAVGALFGFVGYYMVDPKGAKDGGGFVIDSAIRLGSVFRIGGRRSTDTVVVQEAVTRAAQQGGGIVVGETTTHVVENNTLDVPDLAHVPAPEKGS